MKKRKHISRIGLLISISQLLLIVFVIQWLTGQYGKEKDIMEKSLFRQFVNAKQQVMDSMLVETLINPILRSEKGFKVHMEVNNDSVVANNSSVKHEFKTTISTEGNHDFFIVDSARGTFKKKISAEQSENQEKDLLLHGVRLFIKEVSSKPTDSSQVEEHVYFKSDTTLFKKIVSESLVKESQGFNIRWTKGNRIDSAGNKKSVIYFESNLYPSPFGVEVSNFNSYLFKKLSPQFLFALVLLLFTGAAFYLAYKSLKQQIRLSLMKDDFISNISHELKTPVSTVKVAIEALKDFDMKSNPAVANEYLEMASIEMDRLELLIGKVLNTSSLENGNYLLHPEKLNLSLLIKEVLVSLQMRFNHHEAVVKFETPVKECIVIGDKFHLQGVLINILDNSLKYSEQKPQIFISLNEINDKITLSISDNGPGIPEEYKDKIFEKFFRIPTGNKHNVKGYGLGLSYAALVMKQHQGTIRALNHEANGCTIALTFPKI